MAALWVLLAFVAVALAGVWWGSDSRPGPCDEPPAWIGHRGVH
jgi:hypothetical protein